MTENVCKNCNAPLDLSSAKHGVISCEFCGSVYTLPKADQSDSVVRLISAGQTALDLCRFDDALTAFTKAIELDGSEPEAYWGRAQARNRVQYLKDTVNNRLQPICHEATEERFTFDADYKKALNLATAEQRAEYKRKAEEIDYIRSEFFKLNKSGLKYDCFICVKVTDDNGDATNDCMAAYKLYNALKKSGYRPFFSEEEMGSRTGADYEALILYALKSAPCMLIVCFDRKYLETKWVKNEYTRYISMIADEEKERSSITAAFRGSPIEKLPGVKGKIQGIDFNSFDAIERIKQFIDSHDEIRKRAAEAELEERARAELYAREKAERERAERREAEANEARLKEKKQAEELAEMRAEMARLQAELADRRNAVKPADSHNKAASPQAEAGKEDGYDTSRFSISNGVLVKYSGTDETVTVPAGVKAIGDWAFFDNGLKRLRLPEGLKSIKNNAFYDCAGLEAVNIPSSVSEIGIGAFYSCAALKGLRLPEGITSVGFGAFQNCSSLETVNFPASAAKVGYIMFSGCKALKSVLLPEGIKSIESKAFYGCSSLETVNIPSSVEAIEGNAFAGCEALKEIYIPDGVKRLGEQAFAGCTKLERASVPVGAVHEGKEVFDRRVRVTVRGKGASLSAMNGPAVGPTVRQTDKTASPQAQAGKEDGYDKSRFSISNGVLVKYSGTDETVTVPAAVKGIGDRAFSANGLKKLRLPEGIKSIKDYAFENCKNLEAIDIPSSVSEIGDRAFCGCAALKSLRLPEGITAIGFGTFQDCSSLETVNIPSSVSEIGDWAFYGCAALKSIRLPDGIKSIGSYAFSDCIAVTAIDVPSSVAQMGDHAFSDCKALAEARLREGITAIGSHAFCRCGRLASVAVPESVKTIDSAAFYSCEALKKLRLPEGIKSIKDYAFENCISLEAADIPASVEEIGKKAFAGCEALKDIYIPDGVQTIGEQAFADCTKLERASVPVGAGKVGKEAFNGRVQVTVRGKKPVLHPKGWAAKWNRSAVRTEWEKDRG